MKTRCIHAISIAIASMAFLVACSSIGEPQVSKSELENDLSRAQLTLSVARAVVATIPECTIPQTTSVCLSAKTIAKVSAYTGAALSAMDAAKAVLSASVYDPVAAAKAVSRVLEAAMALEKVVNSQE